MPRKSIYEILGLPTNYPTMCIKSVLLGYNGSDKELVNSEYDILREKGRKAYDLEFNIKNDDIVSNNSFSTSAIFDIASFVVFLNKKNLSSEERENAIKERVDEWINKIKNPNSFEKNDDLASTLPIYPYEYEKLVQEYNAKIMPEKTKKVLKKIKSGLKDDTYEALEIYIKELEKDYYNEQESEKRSFTIDRSSFDRKSEGLKTKNMGKRIFKKVLISGLVVLVAVGTFKVVKSLINSNYVDDNEQKMVQEEERKEFNYELEFGDYSVENIEKRLGARPGSITLISGELKQAGDIVTLEAPSVIANGYEETKKNYIVEIDTYTVKEDDTLNKIAKYYINNDLRVRLAGITNEREFARELGENNENITNINVIVPGEKIVIRFKVSSDVLEKYDNENLDYTAYEDKGLSYS